MPRLPRPYKHGGWALAALTAVYGLGWWFALTGAVGNAAIYGLAIVVLTLLSYGMYAVDWAGYATLGGLIQWGRAGGGAKFWWVCAFLFLPEFLVGIYLVRSTRDLYRATQQRPGAQLAKLRQQFRQRPRTFQAGLAAGALVAIIAFCSGTSLALGSGHPPFPEAIATTAAQTADSGSAGHTQGGGSSSPHSTVAATSPTDMPEPTATATATPTATPTTTPTPSLPHFGDGTYQVGTDIPPGTYRTRVGSSGCCYARLKGFGGTLNEIIANNNTDAPAVVTIAATDKGFESQNCGTWTQDLSQITQSKTSVDDGMYIVGTDIAPGTYRNTGSQGCYYARLRGFGNTLDDIIANNNVDTPTIVTIAASDKGFESHGCGTWAKQ